LLMDESHRYRASAGVRAINELKPLMGLELTATPFVETGKGAVAFKNVIIDYPLGKAMADGFVKEPAVVTRKNFHPAGMSPEEIERLKLEDGVRLHEQTKVLLETYARESDQAIVKPFMLIIAKDTTHAGQLMQMIRREDFFEGRYKAKVIQVDSSKTGAEADEVIERLLKVEHADEPTEIVIHVNMLKEGWDVTNLYTIVPLRAANARILIEQSIGRGLRLPYGKRTGVAAVDRLNIVAHDKFQEIIDEANRADSPIRLQAIVLAPEDLTQKTKTVVSPSRLDTMLGIRPLNVSATTVIAGADKPKTFADPEEEHIAQVTRDVIRKLESQPQKLPSLSHLSKPEIQAEVMRGVAAQYRPAQLEMKGIRRQPDIGAIVQKTSAMVIQQTISIPRIIMVPRGEVKCGFKPFTLELGTLNYQPPSEELWVQYLRTGGMEVIGLGKGGIREARLEDYVVSGLVDFDDVAYDNHADLLYDLAKQTVEHFRSYLSEEDTRKVLRLHQREIARFIHAQMQRHYWEGPVDYEVVVRQGSTELKQSVYTQSEPTKDFRQSPEDKSNMSGYLFGGFQRCLHWVEKFDSEAERILAVILDREASKWFKPAKGQFGIIYKSGADYPEYQPDFVAETKDVIYMLEPKARNQMDNDDVLAKRDAAVTWCERASAYAASCGDKPWRYALIPHDLIKENMTLEWLVQTSGLTK
ncbi:MAG: type III restriction endonuclease subunit R, partial [Dehalococcoidia bacterium]|nr:type III restriction endonuclease subunit R [Dehalococcoidia bacterium]